ncbi:type I polyketide synthase [Actinokineospora iranica]|uniref:Acyl transferase domain-containing protein n=1 Tax=Actinokineospora iranica TaxID=1271860 RepID=A0A1G6Z1L0_9PSEU|nr:type I polyketide synthase [Actinokineospora iranica]SDD96634.1 Acyl transferase domain-containing protein [Actinokineospora iranica]
MTTGSEHIAVVGIDCRFPGAGDKDAFWDMLVRGEHGVSEVPAPRWDGAAFHDAAGGAGRVNTRFGAFMSDPDAFDFEFFGVSPREAAAMDPQQRMLLQAAWRAVEDSGVAPGALAGSATGVFVGMMSSEWATLHLSDYPGLTAHRGSGNGYCMAANRVSYHLDLRGPSTAVDTACSSSLVATHLAANAIRAGDCDQAIVAGVNLMLTPALSIFYTQAGLSAPDGRCKPFSGAADGIGRGEGVGVVVLRRLSDALADRQPVYAVIEGSAVNQDGRSNGITAPSRWSQESVLTAAYARAGVRPRDIAFVEGHGTGTTLGDMIEVKALGAVHGGPRPQPCLLGSVKGNIGHAEGAAGIAGLIKACLALDRRVLPPTLHSETESPRLKLAEQGLRLARGAVRLPKGANGTVRGAVSSFGLGGTNAHVVLASAPVVRRPAEPGGVGVLTVSANTAAALRRNIAALAEAVEGQPDERLGQLCHSTNRVKSGLRQRVALAATSVAQARAELRGLLRDSIPTEQRGKPKVAFLFTGQGSQFAGMGAALRAACPPFRDRLAEADAALRPHLGVSISAIALDGKERDGLGVDATALTQPALFALQYALAAALADLGVRPDAVLGHSVGEFAAACATGVLTLAEAAAMIATRGALMQALPPGGAMIAVRAGADEVADLVAAEPLVSIAAVNGPDSVVLSGDAGGARRIAAALAESGRKVTELVVSHGFHSPLMTQAARDFGDRAFSGIAAPRPATAAFASTVRGRFAAGDELDPAYWVEQITAPVRFADAMAALARREPTHLVEIGPRGVLLGLAVRAGLTGGAKRLVPVPGAAATGAEFAATLATLYSDGMDLDWDRLYRDGQRVPRRLPGYVFADTERFWASAATVRGNTASVVTEKTVTEDQVSPRSERPVRRLGDGPVDAVLAAVAEIGDYAVADLAPEAKLHEDLGFDSIMVMQLGDQLTEVLRLTEPIPVEELLPRVTTVGELLAFAAEVSQEGKR